MIARTTFYKPLLLIAFLTVSLMVRGQLLRHYSLPTLSQMPVAHVNAVAQSHEGLMWYATDDGLLRDNGYQIDVFKPGVNDGGVMRSAHITCLSVENGRVIFGTDNGAYVLDLLSYRMDSLRLPREAGWYVYSVLQASDKSVWVKTNYWGTVVKLSDDLRTVSTFRYKTHHGGQLYEDSQHRIWDVQEGDGLCYWSKAYGSPFLRVNWDASAPTTMIEAGNNRFWVGTRQQGIVLFDYGSGRVTPQPASLWGSAADRHVLSLVADKRFGIVWASTEGGLSAYRVAGGQLVRLAPVAHLETAHLMLGHLFADRDENIWVAGYSPSTFIIALDQDQVRRTELAEFGPTAGGSLLLSRMVSDGDGYYWTFLENRGLYLYHADQAPAAVTDALPGSYFTGLLRSSLGSGILVADGTSILHLWHEGMRIRMKPVTMLNGQGILDFQEDAYGRLWIATMSGISLYSAVDEYLPIDRGGRQLVRQHDLSLLSDVSADGHVCWYAVGNKLYRLTDRGDTTALTLSDEVTGIASWGDSAWVGTQSGRVYCCGRTSYSCHPEMDDLRRSRIKQIVVDKVGDVWTLTDMLVSRYSIDGHDRVSWQATDPDVRMDYFYALEPDARGMCVTGAGAYCLMPYSHSGFTPKNRSVLPTVTTIITPDTTILVGYRPHMEEVPSTSSSLTLCLSTPEHLRADKVTFAYRLGLHGQWITLEQGQNRAYLNHLSKGMTDVYVRATDRYGKWGQERLCITINRLPRWWESWWAYSLYVLALAVLLGVLIYLGGRIDKLQYLKEYRQQNFLGQPRLDPKDINDRVLDSAFTKRLLATIEAHLDDPDYNVQRLADDMSMSRASLFRKTKAMTGQNPTAFVRDIRLSKAAALLEENPDARVADIAAKVGFATPQYFNKCFKKKYGRPPKNQ